MSTREPSVHITKAQFLQVLDDLEIKAFPVDAFFRLASKRAINSRGILVKNKRTTKTVTKVLLASTLCSSNQVASQRSPKDN